MANNRSVCVLLVTIFLAVSCGTKEVDTANNCTYYADADDDGYGDLISTITTTECVTALSGYVGNDMDCNDSDSTINPAAMEVCNEFANINEDCNLETVADQISLFADMDSDGYGDPGRKTMGCEASDGFVADNTDCDDINADINPGATEICNDVDDDCDGLVDSLDIIEMDSLTVSYPDRDGDHFGDANSPGMTTCGIPTGNVADYTDCDDQNAAVNPDATEVCDEVDNDCNGLIDDGASDATTWYLDLDGDGFGSISSRVTCESSAGWIDNNTDCNDGNPNVYPGATEIDNNIDDDCDGTIDE